MATATPQTGIDSTAESQYVLRTEGLSKHFGGLKAVQDVSLRVKEGTLHSVIGPNGAGKTTLFNLISGRFEPTSGKIFFRGQDITGTPQHRIAHLGIARSYQLTTVFLNLTVFENIRVSAQAILTQFNFWRHADRIKEIKEQTERTLEVIGLADKRDLLAAQLSHAEQRQLDVGIALVQNPRLLLLDEPTAGMSPIETEAMMHFISDLAQRVSIILVEHKMNVVMSVSDRITVLNFGNVLAEGTPEEIRQNKRVQEVYLEGSV